MTTPPTRFALVEDSYRLKTLKCGFQLSKKFVYDYQYINSKNCVGRIRLWPVTCEAVCEKVHFEAHTMIRSISALASVLVLASAGGALAAPYGGASLISAPVDLQSSRQLSLRQPDLVAATAGLQVQGMACVAALRPNSHGAGVLVQHMSSDGRVLDTASARVAGLRDGNARCGVYSAKTAWKLAPAESIKVCAAQAGACATGAD